jgi:hypothetical protein
VKPKATVVPLRTARLRRLERRLDAVEAHLEQATDVLTRLVRIVAVLHRRYGGTLGAPERRVERLTRAVTRGRTADLRRLVQLERRLATLERRVHR